MGVITLIVNVHSADRNAKKTMQFEPSMFVFDACKIIREKMGLVDINSNEYGLLRVEEDTARCVWLDNGRRLKHYLLRNQDSVEYRNKMRMLKVRLLDNTVKTIAVDESRPLSQLIFSFCTKIGISNHHEYSLVRELPTKDQTDEELNWVDHEKTLMEQGIGDEETLLLRRKYFFSDTNVDWRDPVQLTLLYVQCRDGVLRNKQPVDRETALQLAALQCQVQYGDFPTNKSKFTIDGREVLHREYTTSTENNEKKVVHIYKELSGTAELDAKRKYIDLCCDLNTYGVTFFLVWEKLRGKRKMLPRLLGVGKESVARVNANTKEVVQEWPLEHIRKRAQTARTFTIDFGDYAKGFYTVQTKDAEKIATLVGGYIDILILKKRMLAAAIEADEASMIKQHAL